mgnify:CR=1 FL=1
MKTEKFGGKTKKKTATKLNSDVKKKKPPTKKGVTARKTSAGKTAARKRDFVAPEKNKRTPLGVSVSADKSIILGKIDGTGKNYAFFVPDDGSLDVFVAGEKLHGAIEGDVVEARIISHVKEGGEGEVVKILESPNEKFVGTVEGNDILPDLHGMPQRIHVSSRNRLRCKTGEKVYARIIERGKENYCVIEEKLGLAGNTDAEVLGVIRSYNIEENFPRDVLACAEKINGTLSGEERNRREDFTGDTVITIDGAHSKDFDDAVCVKRLPGGGYRLYVHIADVTQYVKEGDPIDKCAFDRATSVYFADRVIPMLPEKLCNDVCSLVEGENRPVLSCVIDYSADGEVTAKRVTEGIIRSSARTTYDEIYAFMQNDPAMKEKYAFLSDMLEPAVELYKILNKKRMDNGSIEFDFIETEIEVDEKGDVVDVRAVERNDAHKMIEEFMLAANAAVASVYDKLKLPFVYRVHAAPPAEKLEGLTELLQSIGVELPDEPTPSDVANMLASVDGRYKDMVNFATLRSMSKAEYKATNDGHYGLNFADYCHFTSPIRRYPDLAIHRIIKKYLAGEKNLKARYSQWVKDVSKKSSERERRAEEAERKVDDVLVAKYMARHVGEIYPAKISGVTEWGVFARIANGIEGCVRVEKLPGGEYSFDKNKFRLSCGKRCYKPGDPVVIKVDDVTGGKINFSFVEGNENA